MVERDMVHRLRPVLLLLAVLAAVALVAPRNAAATDSAFTSSDQHAAVAVKSAPSRTVADRIPRPSAPLVPVALVFAGLAPVALRRSRHDRLIGHRLRRLHDVGHDWRSLLLGAPPAVA
jgi:hypothetical protein